MYKGISFHPSIFFYIFIILLFSPPFGFTHFPFFFLPPPSFLSSFLYSLYSCFPLYHLFMVFIFYLSSFIYLFIYFSTCLVCNSFYLIVSLVMSSPCLSFSLPFHLLFYLIPLIVLFSPSSFHS